METLTKLEIDQESLSHLKQLQSSLNYLSSYTGLMSNDDACDIFSDALYAIGKDHNWWCEQ